MKMLVNYIQSRDKRWKAGEQVGATVTPDGIKVEWAKSSTSSGVCLGLSIYWIITKYNKIDFWDWLKPPANACPQRPFQPTGTLPTYWSAEMKSQLGGATIAIEYVKQVMHAQAEKTNDTQWVKAYPLTKSTIEKNTTLVCQSDGTDSIPIKKFTGQDGYYVIYLIGLSEKSNDIFRHAIACEVNNNDVTLFDPNFGEATGLQANHLPAFCKHLLKVDYEQDFMSLVGFLRFA